MVAFVMITVFVISLLTNIVGPLVPDIIDSFHVSLTAAAFLAFSFFTAYQPVVKVWIPRRKRFS
jgi:MFS transporter, FHS family, L-fucose permease